ncbi:2971_t:CDS:2, partial [Dentiscutata heterogama]
LCGEFSGACFQALSAVCALCDEFSGACSWALSVLCGVFVLEHFQHYVVNSPWQFW